MAIRLRNLEKASGPNDGTRSLFDSILVPEVKQALKDWTKAGGAEEAVLIGGVALSFYVKPRMTTDSDFLFKSASDIPDEVPAFKHHRKGAFQHNRTHVEIEVLTRYTIQVDSHLLTKVFQTAHLHDGIMVASKEALVALKLRRWNKQDQADVEALFRLDSPPHMDVSWLRGDDRVALLQLLHECNLPSTLLPP